MKLSNFKYEGAVYKGLGETTHFASLDVTTGFWFWKKTVNKKISSNGGSWMFVDTGEFTPGYQVEAMYRSWKAMEALKLLPR